MDMLESKTSTMEEEGEEESEEEKGKLGNVSIIEADDQHKVRCTIDACVVNT